VAARLSSTWPSTASRTVLTPATVWLAADDAGLAIAVVATEPDPAEATLADRLVLRCDAGGAGLVQFDLPVGQPVTRLAGPAGEAVALRGVQREAGFDGPGWTLEARLTWAQLGCTRAELRAVTVCTEHRAGEVRTITAWCPDGGATWNRARWRWWPRPDRRGDTRRVEASGMSPTMSIALLTTALWPCAADTTIHISPTGNDAWSGRLPAATAAGDDGPVRTLSRARDLLRGTPVGVAKTVVLAGGVHRLATPLELGPQDSGVTWAPPRARKPIVSGGVEVTEWRAVADGLWRGRVPSEAVAVGVRQMRVGERAQTLARYPNRDPQEPLTGGWLFAKAAGRASS